MEGKNQNREKQQQLETCALKYVEDGLRIANESKEKTGADANRSGLIDLHGAAIEVLIARKEKMDAAGASPRRADKNERSRGDCHGRHSKGGGLHPGGETRFSSRRTKKVTANSKAASMRPLAWVLLAHIYLTNEQPLEAAATLKELEKVYARFEEINPAERAWLLEFLSDPRDLAMLSVYAELETAVKKIVSHYEHNPSQPFRIESLQPHETAAAAAVSKLNANTDANRCLRVYFTGYYLRTSPARQSRRYDQKTQSGLSPPGRRASA